MKKTATPWKKKAIAFLISQGITLFGSSLVQMAIIWYVTLQTSSGIWVTILTLCAFLPQMFLSFFAGVWADRHSRKALIIAADIAIAAATLGLALMMLSGLTGQSSLPAIIAVSLVRSLGSGIQTPAVNAMIPQLVPEEKLLRFNGINSSMQAIVQFGAPAAAGALMAFGSLSAILMIDVATAAIGVTLLAFLRIPRHRNSAQGQAAPFFTDMKAGIRFAFRDGFIGKLLLLYGAFILLSVPSGFLTALMIERTFGGSYLYLSASETVGFAGMVLGGLLLGVWGGFKNRNRTLFLGLLLYAAFAVLLGTVTQFWLFAAAIFLLSFAIPIVQSSMTTMLQEKVATEMQGRVFSLLNVMFSGFMPLGMALFGPMADLVPIRWLMLGTGGILLVLAVALPCFKAFYLGGIPEEKQPVHHN